jgi:hypothetical protein
VPTRLIQRHNDFGSNLPRNRDIGESRIHRRSCVLAPWTVKVELNQGHELVQRLFLGWTTGETTRQIKGAVLDREAPIEGFNSRGNDGSKLLGR